MRVMPWKNMIWASWNIKCVIIHQSWVAATVVSMVMPPGGVSLIPVLKHAVCIGVISSMGSIGKPVFMILCRWVDDFSRMQLGRDVPKPEAWAADFAQQQENAPGRSASWNQIWDDSSAGPSNEWATEFGQTGAAMVRLCEIALDALYSIAHS